MAKAQMAFWPGELKKKLNDYLFSTFDAEVHYL